MTCDLLTGVRKADHFPELVSQRELDLDADWWAERIRFYGVFTFHEKLPWWFIKHHSFQNHLDGYYWNYHQLLIGSKAIEWRTRGKKKR